MSPRICLALGACIAGLAIVLGAFGAHWLESQLPRWYVEPDRAEAMLANWETGIRYQFYSAVGLMVLGLWASQQADRRTTWVAANFVLGTLLFSGMLYAYVLTADKRFAMIVPLGGFSMIAGWLIFGWQAYRSPPP